VNVCVIGAGVAGLVAARRLGLGGHRVEVLERWPGLGGQVATGPVEGGDPLEHYYHHLFTTDKEIAALYEELGMGADIEWLPSSMAIHRDGVSVPFTSPGDLLRFRAMSPLGRVRMGAGALALQRTRGGVERFESITARAMVERWMGPEAWRVVWGPLMEGKFAGRSEEISAAWLWNKLNLRRRIDGRGAGKEMLGYPRGSWQPLLDRLAADIEAAGGSVRIDAPASAVRRGAGAKLEVGVAPEGAWRSGVDPAAWDEADATSYDAVVATVPSPIFSALLRSELRDELGADYMERVDGAEYGTAVCLVLELDRQFGPFYWTNVADPGIPFIGTIEQGNLVGTERYGGRHFFYVANYVLPGDPLIGLGTDELIDLYAPHLAEMGAHGFDPAWVKGSRVYREAAAQPIVTLGYQERIPALETPATGLYLANTTQIYPEDRGTNYSVRLGEQVAELIGPASG
jgi:protoporphyrinogen oxidase